MQKLPYEKKGPKHEPTDSYFHQEIQLEKCMMRSNNLNGHNYGGYTEINAPSLNVNFSDEDKSKFIIVHKSLSENRYTDINESKHNITKKTLSQNNIANVSQYNMKELGDKEYKEPLVTKEVKIYFNILQCVRNILDRLEVTYQ